MIPPNECLQAVDLPAYQLHFKLEVEHERIRLDRLAQFSTQGQSRGTIWIAVHGIYRIPTARCFSSMHRNIRELKQSFTLRGMIGEKRDAQADAQMKPSACQIDGLLQHMGA